MDRSTPQGRARRGTDLLRDRDARLLGISTLVGLAVGLGAFSLVWALHGVELAFEWAAHEVGDPRWFPVITVPLGILGAWWVARRFAPEVSGDGVPETIAGLTVGGGYLSTRSIPMKIVATALTLGGGGSAGREGPIVQIGGAIGSSISRRFRLGEDQIRSLVAAGAGAAIGASFNAPIAGMLFAMEVILRTFSVRHLSSVVIASVTAAVTFRSLPLPDEALLAAASYGLGDARELLLYAGLALLAVLVAVLFLKLVDRVERSATRVERPAWLRPVLFGLLVGVIGVVEPAVLGTGQEFVSELLRNQFFEGISGVPQIAWYVLLALVAGKVVATAFTISSGGSGGAFMPSLFIGAALGAGYAELAQQVWTFSEIRPGAFAVVGMATVFAAVARAPLTAILIVFEVTGARDYGLVLPLMLSATFATFVADRFHPESIYTLPLTRRGIQVVRAGDFDLLDTIAVEEVMSPVLVTVSPSDPLAEARQRMDRHRSHGLAVVEDGRLVGIVAVSDLQRGSGPSPASTVGQVMTSKPATVGPSTPVSVALQRMAVLGVGRLPVVSDEDASRLVGMFRREDAVRAYHVALGASTDRELARQRFRQRTDPGTDYFDFRVPPGSVADGRAVREVAWPEGCTLVSVRRGTDVIVPTGASLLEPGDVVTAFGTPASHRQVIERLNAGADEPTAEIVLNLPDDPRSGPGQR
ncbi:MAG: chloride channel protein [Acidimicrobiia bacterium]|jgi:chloride channel protein, CIC family